MAILKIEHSFVKDILLLLKNSCKDTVQQHAVNFICKDGAVSCDHTVLVSNSEKWKKILMTTHESTNYIIAPDYSMKFMKSYLISSIFDGAGESHCEDDVIDGQGELEKKQNFDTKLLLENKQKFDTKVELENEEIFDPDDSTINDEIDIIITGLIEKVVNKSTLIESFKVKNNRACNICLKTFSKASYCREHMISMHSESKKYQCDQCESKFNTKNGLKLHMDTSHENESKDPFICTVCGAVFLYKRSLLRHCKAEQHDSYPKATSKGKGSQLDRRTKCSICHKMIVHFMLEDHIEENHTDKAREFKCGYKKCGFKTKRNDSLQRHKREVHLKFKTELEAIKETFTEGSSYQCPDCKETLWKSKDVEDHLVGKICSLTCMICNKIFSRKHNLKQHMKKIHQKNLN